MILDHCVSLLNTGTSAFTQNNFTDELKVCFKLQSGVTAKRLDSIKTALMMLEMIKVAQRECTVAQQHEKFSNFTDYIFANFPEPMAMAIIQYAIKDRNLMIPKMSETAAWKMISKNFKPVMLDNTKDPQEVKKYGMFERFYKKLKSAAPLSAMINEYMLSEAESIQALQ